MLHLYGILIAIEGLILACFARGHRRTARLQAVPSKEYVLAQQAGET